MNFCNALKARLVAGRIRGATGLDAERRDGFRISRPIQLPGSNESPIKLFEFIHGRDARQLAERMNRFDIPRVRQFRHADRWPE